MDKPARLREFYRRLDVAPPARSLDEAYGQICRILNEVEDELSGIRYNLTTSKSDGRMYPPFWDFTWPDPDRSGVTIFRTALHRIFIGRNGAIEITDLGSHGIEFEKAGEDGQKVGDG